MLTVYLDNGSDVNSIPGQEMLTVYLDNGSDVNSIPGQW